MSQIREVIVSEIGDAIRTMAVEANRIMAPDMRASLSAAAANEESPVGVTILHQILQNADIAAAESMPTCQDTGAAVVFLDIGQDVHLVGGNLHDAVNAAVRQGYEEGYLRKSMCDPFTRANTGDNTPALIHEHIVPGNQVKITFTAKGGGSENASQLKMFPPSAGRQGVVDFVVKVVEQAGPNACPPLVVGVGIGGSFDVSAGLAKKAILRDAGTPNADPAIADLEQEILAKINDLGIGPAGLGGRTTALAVQVEYHPCHIASLPVAVNIQCHANRHREVTI